MREPTAPLHGGALGDWVGISWLMRDIGGVRIVAHGGSMNGQQSAFELVPERGFALTVLTNADAGSLAREGDHRVGVRGVSRARGAGAGRRWTLDEVELARLIGRYDTMHARVDVSARADGIVLDVAYTEEGMRMVRELLGEVPEPKPIPARVIPGDRFLVTEGDAKGMKGNILREPDGSVRAINVGGRLAYRNREVS